METKKNTNELKILNKIINKLNPIHHNKIFNIIKDNNITFYENRNGVFVNLNNLPNKVIDKIYKYIDYIKIQEKNISNFENIKNEFKKDFFTDIKKEDKDNVVINDNDLNESFE